jgi:hypothetical protein
MQALLQDLKNARKAEQHLFFNPLLDSRGAETDERSESVEPAGRQGGVVESLKLNKVFL